MPRYILIFASILLVTGCAAEVGKDNSKDLQNENTALKLQLQDAKLRRDVFFESATKTQTALDACYKRLGEKP